MARKVATSPSATDLTPPLRQVVAASWATYTDGPRPSRSRLALANSAASSSLSLRWATG